MRQRWHIRLMGGLCVESIEGEAREIERFRTQKTAALLAYLAYHGRTSHSRELLMELFWPDCEPESARHSLRMALSALRRQLEEGANSGAVLRADRFHVSLQGAAVSTDVAEFEAAIARADWPGAVELYQGRLLAGFYDDWIEPEARRLEELFFTALHQAVCALERAGDHARALQISGRGPIIDPLHEGAGRDLMRLYAQTQPALALRQFRELEARLHEQLNCAPDAQTRALAARIEADLQLARAQTPVAGAAPTGFHAPLPLTRFFGRSAEIAQIQELLQDARLVTLTGAGGSGKSRLASEALRYLGPLEARWPGGVWLVSLADLSDEKLLTSAILGALRVRPAPDLDALDELVGFLRQRPILLWLDSFEHLVEAGAPLVEELLARVPGLSCLITSRRTLQVAGERIFAVAPLPLPGANESSPAVLMENPSAQLFVDRAQSVAPDFAVTRANAAVIAALCERWEGIPLAIELAAARAGALSPAQMLGLLDQRFELLVSRGRAGVTRHRTLREAIAWSNDLLEPELRAFFAALSVFRGGCTLEAAEFVCGPNALESLEQLRECSLVVARERAGEMRFESLESIREFAAQQLAPARAAELEARHCRYFVQLAESAAPELNGPNSASWLARLSQENDNLRAALEWSFANETELALRLAGALPEFWERRAQIVEAQSWLERARLLPGPPDLRARVLHGAGRIAFVQCDAVAAPLLEESLPLLEASSERALVASALSMLGVIVWNQGDFARASAYFSRQLELWRDGETSQAQHGRALALSQLGNLAAAQCDFETALPLLREAETQFRALNETCGLAYVLDAQGQIALARGQHEAARALLDRSIELYRGADEMLWLIRALWGRGHLARDEGDDVGARQFYRECLVLGQRNRNRMSIPYALEAVAVGEIARGEVARGARFMGAARALRDAIGMIVMPIWNADYDRALSQGRTLLGDAAFERAWAQGAAWNWEVAVARALGDLAIA